MATDNSKGRGKFLGFIELKYVQLTHDLFKILFIDTRQLPEESRKTALWCFIEHYFTNSDYETLAARDPLAYTICRLLDETLFRVQNQARWKCFDEFYEGRDNIDYEMALELYQKKVKEKRSAYDRKRYQQKKIEESEPEYLTGEQEMQRILKEKGIDI